MGQLGDLGLSCIQKDNRRTLNSGRDLFQRVFFERTSSVRHFSIEDPKKDPLVDHRNPAGTEVR